MTDLLHDGLTWMRGQLQQFAARTVTYARGAQTAQVLMTVGRTAFRLGEPLGGSRVERSDRDGLIGADQLTAFPGGPLRGDRVIDGSETYTVLPVEGEPPARPSDNYGVIWRVHLKKVT